jgi:hypothetical protein
MISGPLDIDTGAIKSNLQMKKEKRLGIIKK